MVLENVFRYITLSFVESAKSVSVGLVDTENSDSKSSSIIYRFPSLAHRRYSWCGPCQMLGPILAEVAAENSSFKVAKINVDEESALAERFGVMNIPTLAVFKDGKIVNSSVGVISKEAIVDLVK